MSSDQKPRRAAVRRRMLEGKKPAACVSLLDAVCKAGAASPEVQGSTVARCALRDLKRAVKGAGARLGAKRKAAEALARLTGAVEIDFTAIRGALGVYLAAVEAIAKGNGAVIRRAGLESRDARPEAAKLGRVPRVWIERGKEAREAILRWEAGPGATGYAIEVSFASGEEGSWEALPTGSARRRVVRAPAPGCRVAARVASIGAYGDRTGWSEVTVGRVK